MTTNTIAYIVTELAGPQVAGRRVSHGETIVLSENEARGELLAGVIALPPAASPASEEVAPIEGAEDTKKRR